jgi:hypothetical protein
MRHAQMVICAVLAASCSRSEAGGQFDTSLSTQQVMKHVIDPAAIALWGRAGSIETEKGTVYLTPETEEDWAAAETRQPSSRKEAISCCYQVVD